MDGNCALRVLWLGRETGHNRRVRVYRVAERWADRERMNGMDDGPLCPHRPFRPSGSVATSQETQEARQSGLAQTGRFADGGQRMAALSGGPHGEGRPRATRSSVSTRRLRGMPATQARRECGLPQLGCCVHRRAEKRYVNLVTAALAGAVEPGVSLLRIHTPPVVIQTATIIVPPPGKQGPRAETARKPGADLAAPHAGHLRKCDKKPPTDLWQRAAAAADSRNSRPPGRRPGACRFLGGPRGFGDARGCSRRA
jgi:hypothetical protein